MDDTNLIWRIPEQVELRFEPTSSENGLLEHTMMPVTECLSKLSDIVQVATYSILKLTLGIFFAILWGCLIGFSNFMTIWFAHPFTKLWFSVFRCIYPCLRVLTRVWCDPVFESMASLYSRIRGGLHVKIEKVDNAEGLVNVQVT